MNNDECGKMDLAEFKIDTGDTNPKIQVVRRIFLQLDERYKAEQLEKMEENGVIKQSESPWESSVIGKKRDGLLRF